jgi:hypothetical protein
MILMRVIKSGTEGLCHNSSTERSHHERDTRRVLYSISLGEERWLRMFTRMFGGKLEAGECGGMCTVVPGDSDVTTRSSLLSYSSSEKDGGYG